MSYKLGLKCCTNQSLSGVDACIDSDVDADTDSGSADNGLGGIDCGDNGDDASADYERRDRSIGDDGGGDDAGVDMGDVPGTNSGPGDSVLNSSPSDTQSSLTYGVIIH